MPALKRVIHYTTITHYSIRKRKKADVIYVHDENVLWSKGILGMHSPNTLGQLYLTSF